MAPDRRLMRTGAVVLVATVTLFTFVACAPAALSPDEIVPAFIAASQADTRTMRMEWQGTMSIAQSDAPELDPGNQSITATFDFNGPDYAGTMTAGGTGNTSLVSYARVGGVGYINYGESGWQRTDMFGGQAAPDMDPMRSLTAADVTYESPDTRDGRAVHRLRVADPFATFGSGGLFGQGGFMGAEMVVNGPSEYLIFVDGNGIPVSAQLVLDTKVSVPDLSTSEVTYQINFTYTFSLWGEPVTISPPEVTGGGFDDFPPPPRIK